MQFSRHGFCLQDIGTSYPQANTLRVDLSQFLRHGIFQVIVSWM